MLISNDNLSLMHKPTEFWFYNYSFSIINEAKYFYYVFSSLFIILIYIKLSILYPKLY